MQGVRRNVAIFKKLWWIRSQANQDREKSECNRATFEVWIRNSLGFASYAEKVARLHASKFGNAQGSVSTFADLSVSLGATPCYVKRVHFWYLKSAYWTQWGPSLYVRWGPPIFFSVLRLCGSRQVVAQCRADERIIRCISYVPPWGVKSGVRTFTQSEVLSGQITKEMYVGGHRERNSKTTTTKLNQKPQTKPIKQQGKTAVMDVGVLVKLWQLMCRWRDSSFTSRHLSYRLL